MKHPLVILAAGASLSLILLSLWPGVLNDLLFLGFILAILVVPVFSLAALIVGIWLYVQHRLKRLAIPWRPILTGCLIMFISCVLVLFRVPRRIAFATVRTDLERFEPQVEIGVVDDQPHRFGIYKVDQYARDERGGVYFRTYHGTDGLGPDTMSHGFAYQPNAEGSPFGAASYRIRRLGKNWYEFEASNDWF